MRAGFFRPVFTLSYVSRSRLDHLSMGGRSQIDDILRVSRERNRLLNITGALFFNEGRFTQVLEGAEGHVRDVFDSIKRDVRHTDVTVLATDASSTRKFPDWSMAFVGESDAAQAHYASFVKENTAFWRGVTNQALCLLMLELIAIDQKIALKGE